MKRTLRVFAAAWLLFPFLAAAGAADDAGTLYVQAQRFFRSAPTATIGPVVVREPFAVVNFGGEIGGAPRRGQMLFRHFSFGWQLVDGEAARLRDCDLQAFAVPPDAVGALLARSNDLPVSKAPCPRVNSGMPVSVSPDEEAVRALMQTGFATESIPHVALDGGYAFVEWADLTTGGVALFQKQDGRWRKVASGGGYLDACGLMSFGVPAATARTLLLDSFPDDPYTKHQGARVDGCPRTVPQSPVGREV